MPHPRVTVRPSRGPHNALWHFGKDVSRWRVAWNFLWIVLQRWAPWFRMKNWMLRRAGVKVGRHVSVGFEATFDILFPGRITLEDDCIIGYDATILCHGYTRGEAQFGDVRIGKGASVGAKALILPGVHVGEGAIIGAGSVVTRDVPAGEFWAGVPARAVQPQSASPPTSRRGRPSPSSSRRAAS